MSKVGRVPIEYNKTNIKLNLEKGGRFKNYILKVNGPKGELSLDIRPEIKIEIADDNVKVQKASKSKESNIYQGLFRSLIANMIEGVTNGYIKELEIHGMGYRGAQKGTGIELSLGFSHKVNFEPPETVTVTMKNETSIVIEGIDKQQVGQIAAEIRSLKKPEPYKGKGIRYKGEQVKRKAGKSSIV